MKTDAISEDAIFKVGRVIAVRGRSVEIKIDKTKNSSHLLYRGKLLRNVAVGGYLKIVKGFTVIIGKIDGESITEDRFYRDKDYGRGADRMNRIVNVSLLGFFNGDKFERGIKELPLLDNECFLLHLWEFNQVHDFVRPDDKPIVIGNLALEKGQEIRVGVNSLFASHIGIFGNTGSGKSYTLAKIYRELFVKFQDNRRFTSTSKFVLIDFNGEYAGDSQHPEIIIDSARKTCYRLSTRVPQDRLHLSHEFISNPDFWVVFLEATEKTQMPFLKRAIQSPHTIRRLESEASLQGLISDLLHNAMVEGGHDVTKSDVIGMLVEIGECLPESNTAESLVDDYKANLQYNATNKTFYYKAGAESSVYSNFPEFTTVYINAKVNSLTLPVDQIELIDRIRLQIVIQYFSDIFRGFSNREHLSPLLKRMDKRIDSLKNIIAITDHPEEKNFVVISLKDVDIHMKKVVPLLICKQLYDTKKETNDPNTYLNIIIDEAHNILSEKSDRESEQWKDYRLETFEEIIKEGRKFGVFLTIASQRPADISPTIISQLHNYFLHRLINYEDIKAVEKTISYLDRVSFDSLPILPTGTCIMAGLGANVPVVLDIGRIPAEHEPYSKTLTLADKWGADPTPEEEIAELL
jgi:hypothetical protein